MTHVPLINFAFSIPYSLQTLQIFCIERAITKGFTSLCFESTSKEIEATAPIHCSLPKSKKTLPFNDPPDIQRANIYGHMSSFFPSFGDNSYCKLPTWRMLWRNLGVWLVYFLVFSGKCIFRVYDCFL